MKTITTEMICFIEHKTRNEKKTFQGALSVHYLERKLINRTKYDQSVSDFYPFYRFSFIHNLVFVLPIVFKPNESKYHIYF
jgi:hypothetical protein